jgi:hypothetical protein
MVCTHHPRVMNRISPASERNQRAGLGRELGGSPGGAGRSWAAAAKCGGLLQAVGSKVELGG